MEVLCIGLCQLPCRNKDSELSLIQSGFSYFRFMIVSIITSSSNLPNSLTRFSRSQNPPWVILALTVPYFTLKRITLQEKRAVVPFRLVNVFCLPTRKRIMSSAQVDCERTLSLFVFRSAYFPPARGRLGGGSRAAISGRETISAKIMEKQVTDGRCRMVGRFRSKGTR